MPKYEDNNNTFFAYNENKELVEICMETGQVIEAPNRDSQHRYAYSLPVARMVCQKLREGMTLTAIGKLPGMPSLSVIYNWRRQFPDFDEAIKLSREYAAEHLMDEIKDIIDGVEEKDDVFLASFKTRELMKLAEKHNPEKYGTRTKVVGDKNAPLQIVVDTGIYNENQIEQGEEDGVIELSKSDGAYQEDRQQDEAWSGERGSGSGDSERDEGADGGEDSSGDPCRDEGEADGS